jgi:hypothetical protein
LAQIGQEGFNANGQLALQLNDAADRRQKNAVLALAAMENSGVQTSQQVYAIEVRNGQMRFIQPGEGQPPDLQLQAPQEPVTALTCAKCHSGAEAPKGIVLDGSAAFDLQKAMTAVISGKMPPKSNLTPAEKAAVVAELCQSGGLK